MKELNIQTEENPPHVIVDNFFENFEGLSTGAKLLHPLAVQGSHNGTNFAGLVRKELYLFTEPEHTQNFVKLAMDEFWSKDNRMLWDALPQPFALMNNTTFSDLLLGYYNQDDRYSLHHDIGFLTCIMYLHKEKNFTGGDLVLTNQKKHHNFAEKEQVIIEAKPNRLVIFPSCYIHGVTPIEENGGVDCMRIALSHFLSFKVHA